MLFKFQTPDTPVLPGGGSKGPVPLPTVNKKINCLTDHLYTPLIAKDLVVSQKLLILTSAQSSPPYKDHLVGSFAIVFNLCTKANLSIMTTSLGPKSSFVTVLAR